jgi:hypothetical protein
VRSALLLLLLWPAIAFGQSVKLPKEVKGQPGAWIVVVPEDKDGGEVKWHTSPTLTRVPIDKLFPDQKAAGVVVQGPTGRHEVWAWCAKGDKASELAVCTVVIGDAPPVPPGPGPGPTPPTPDDPLTKALQAAYAAEADPKKDEHRKALAGLYRAGAEFAARDDVTTWGRLLSAMREAATATGLDGKVPLLRVAVRDHGLSGLPSEAQRPLDAAGRKLAAETFLKVAVALEGVK